MINESQQNPNRGLSKKVTVGLYQARQVCSLCAGHGVLRSPVFEYPPKQTELVKGLFQGGSLLSMSLRSKRREHPAVTLIEAK